MVCPMMGEEVLPDEEMPVHASPLVPWMLHVVTFWEVHEMVAVSPGCTSAEVALSVAVGDGITMQAPEAQPWAHVWMVAPEQAFTRLSPAHLGGSVHWLESTQRSVSRSW